MITFYFIILGSSLVLFLIFIYFIFYRCNINHNYKNKRRIGYFLPTILSIVTLFLGIKIVYPLLADLRYALKEDYTALEVKLTDKNLKKSYLIAKNNKYIFNPYVLSIKKNVPYRVSYLPHSKLIMKIENISVQEDDIVEGITEN